MVMEALVVLRELASEYEVIVVENGSTDYAWDVLDELERLYGEDGVDPRDRGRVRRPSAPSTGRSNEGIQTA